MKRLFVPAAGLWLLASTPAHALIDTNTNGLSDLWEKAFNGNTLFSAENPEHDPAADPDGDDWTNLQEAAAGTNPFDASAPGGFVLPWIAHTPGTFEQGDEPANPDPDAADPMPILIDPPTVTLTWPSLAGKAYQVAVSENLINWTPASGAFLGAGIPLSYESQNLHADGIVPSKLFLRVAVSDTDTDGDNLTDWEEGSLGTNPNSPDTDRDGIPDDVEIADGGNPLTNHLLLDPDGAGMPAEALASLVAWWDMQPPPPSYSPLTLPSRSADLSGAFHSLSQPSGSVSTLSISGKAIRTPANFPDRIDLLALGQNSSLRSRNALTLHYWIRLPKDHLTPAFGKNTPLEITLAAYGNIGTEVPTIEWSARRAPNGGTRFLLDQGNRINSTNWFLPGAHDTPRLLDDDLWHHIALVIAGNNTRMWLDGVQVGPTSGNLTGFSIPSTVYTTAGYISIGGGPRFFQPGIGAPYLASDLIGEVDGIMLHHARLDSPDPLIFQKIHRRDRDKDGLWDITEAATALWRDINTNTVRDPGETTYTSSPDEWNPPGSDTDGDGLGDIDEQTRGTDIANPDSDGDLLPDGWEVDNNLDPLNSTGLNGGGQGSDTDGASNLNEYINNSNPRLNDTDGDGKSDAEEINGPDGNPDTDDGSNPNDGTDGGQRLPAAQRVTMLLGVGDESGSESEDYVMHIYRIDPETGAEIRFHTHRSGGYGQYNEKTLSFFRKGETYTFQIDWQASNNNSKSAGTTPAEGPDYDYTFKVQPQGNYLGKLIPSWDSATGATNGTALAVTGASNVADTQQEFETNYERRRVAIVAPKLEWQAIEGFDNLDTHTDPWTNTAKGKRIFPCRKNPNDNQIRHKVKLVATGGLKGVELFVKSFDIDDSTDEAFDTNSGTTAPVIDINSRAGADNRPDYHPTALAGHFWDNATKKWGGSNAKKTFGADGRAVFDYRVGMQPGNNYRVVASVGDSTGYASVHVLNDTQPGYLGYELGQDGGAIACEALTVWRRLWVENDSMAAISPDTSGHMNNYFVSEVGIPGITNSFPHANGNSTWLVISPVKDFSSFDALEKGRIIFQGVAHPVVETDVIGGQGGSYHVRIQGDHTAVPAGTSFRLYDDDDFGLAAPPLLRNNLAVTDGFMRKLYATSFIEITDAGDYNENKTVPFQVHDPLLPEAQSVTSNARELIETKSLWIAPLTTAYQLNIQEDGDPLHELPTYGATTPINGLEQSVVYVEACREDFDSDFRLVAEQGSNPQIGVNARKNLVKYIIAQAAHEIGHQPGTQDGEVHHAEDGIMRVGGANSHHPDDEKFSVKSVLRFRNSENWSK